MHDWWDKLFLRCRACPHYQASHHGVEGDGPCARAECDCPEFLDAREAIFPQRPTAEEIYAYLREKGEP
jgi:hypothetical protein